MSALALTRLVLFAGFLASALYVHYRGRVRLSFRRQLTDHSTFLAPYNVLVYLFSRVPTTPMLDVERFPEVASLRANWRTIREEALRLCEAGHIRASERHDDLGFNTFFRKGWKRFYLKWYGAPLPSARALCPRTVALVESIPTVHGAMFALLGPQAAVGEHRDPFAGSIRYHLGLITPNRDECRIFVDGQSYSWRDGQDLVFDETYVHRFENRTDQTRIILFCDVERPLRTAVMRALNGFVIRHIVGLTASKNVDGEEVGLANRVFEHVYRTRAPLKRFKKANRQVYYALKYALIVAVLWVAVFGGYRVLR
ncbi:MAG: aspartyl/asparaginyl beta-hydroxylase domain-containing protein [Deltaproteobacteria bacterium]|nr:aspartyl/asparaginyl beta-hydroxylase domain-containing protein [Deltaproteobacteria bacterium]